MLLEKKNRNKGGEESKRDKKKKNTKETGREGKNNKGRNGRGETLEDCRIHELSSSVIAGFENQNGKFGKHKNEGNVPFHSSMEI